jgi:hypothetical protein
MSCAGKQTQTPTTETYYETEYRTEPYTVVEDVVVGTVEGSSILGVKSQWKSTWIGFFDKGDYWTDYYGYDISNQAHTRRQVQISLKINPQLNKGAIEVVNLTDACSDKNIKSIPNAGQVFGKEPTGDMGGGQYFIPAEGCQLLNPNVVDWKALRAVGRSLDIPERILGEFSIGEDEGDSITFDANGVKEFAIFVATEPKISAPDVTLTWTDDIVEAKTVTKERQVPVQVEKQRPISEK